MPPTEAPGFPPTMPINASGPFELPVAAPIASALKARAPAMRSPVRDTLIDERIMSFPRCVDARERARRMPGSITLQGPPLFAGITSTKVGQRRKSCPGRIGYFSDLAVEARLANRDAAPPSRCREIDGGGYPVARC